MCLLMRLEKVKFAAVYVAEKAGEPFYTHFVSCGFSLTILSQGLFSA